MFRPAVVSDAPAIARIQNLRGEERWCPEGVFCSIRSRDPRYPLLVGVVGAGGVHAFCSLAPADGGVLADAGIDPGTLVTALPTRCLLVLWRQALALDHHALVTRTPTGLMQSKLVLDWQVTDAGFRLELEEAGPVLEAAERRLSMGSYLVSAGFVPDAGTVPPGFAAV